MNLAGAFFCQDIKGHRECKSFCKLRTLAHFTAPQTHILYCQMLKSLPRYEDIPLTSVTLITLTYILVLLLPKTISVENEDPLLSGLHYCYSVNFTGSPAGVYSA